MRTPEGKAGSLVDDRGHFYKPIQPGPRGDRERAFYEAVVAAVAADKAAWARGAWTAAAMAAVESAHAAAAAAAAPAPRPPRDPSRPASAPVAVPSPRADAMPRFPSFRLDSSIREGAGLTRDRMEVLQRDELGLIGEEVDEEWLTGDSSGAEDGGGFGGGASPPRGGRARRARRQQRAATAAVDAAAVLSDGSGDGTDLFSRSPDSDDGGEVRTGDAVMDGISQVFGAIGARPRRDGGGAAAAAIEAAVYGHTTTTAAAAATAAAVRVHCTAESAAAEGAAAAAQPPCRQKRGGGGGGGSPPGPTLGASRKSSSTSADSVEEVLRLHQLAVADGVGGAAGGRAGEVEVEGGGEGRGKGSAAPGRALEALPFTVRNAPLLRVIPKFYGVRDSDGRVLLELEDLARWYRHPCIMDVKVGRRTWYPQAEAAYIERCRAKDAATTQRALGFKICGMQVWRHAQGGYWRASKRWCKTLPEAMVDKALVSFAHNEHGLRPNDVYGGTGGAVAQLQELEAWFSSQREFSFYSSSVLLLYEGDAQGPRGADVRVRLVDFAHTFHDEGAVRDDNFLAGLRSLVARLTGVASLDAAGALL